LADITALDKYPCAACGAQAQWNPAKQLLVCPFCGSSAPFSIDAATLQIEELDLAKALREIPDQDRGWQAEKRTVQCQSCKAVSVFDPDRVGQNCDFCGSPSLVDYAEIKAPIRPQSLLPFTVTEANVREQIRKWYASKWLAPGKLKSRALVDRVHGVYIPYWTFDAQVVCPWDAEAGHYYYTTETYQEGGRTRTRQVRHVRWVPASGEIQHFFDDEPIPGTRGVSHTLLKQVEPFPTQELRPYDRAYLSGFVVEQYQIVLFDAAQSSQEAMAIKLQAMAAAQIPGDTYRNLQIHPVYSARTFKHILVPVWLLSYKFREKAYQVVVNGVTGMMAGEYPKSPWKIALLVLAAIIVALTIAMLSQN
jgi:Zn finger protein HypA/HybF involved in hydrogenase expression